MIYLRKFIKLIFYFFRLSFEISPYKELSCDKIKTAGLPALLKDNDNVPLKIYYIFYISQIKKDKFSLYISEILNTNVNIQKL